MSRLAGEQQVIVRPATPNVYTVLAIVGVVVTILALYFLFTRAKDLIGSSGLM